MTDQDFAGKVALVTGAASGIGLAVAQQLASRGASVVISDINKDAAEKVASDITAAGQKAAAVACNTADPASVEASVKFAVDTFGALNLVVNNAGIGGGTGAIADHALEDWDKVISINLSGVFYGMKYSIPELLKAGGGSIVNVSSILGAVGFAQSCGYVSAKHGVVGLTKTAALDYAAQGLRINAVGPGFIETPLLGDIDRQFLVGLHPQGRLGRPEEVAALIVFLLSDGASFVNGAYYPVDGAYLAQ